MPTPQQLEELALLQREVDRRRGEKFKRYFPDCKPTCVRGSMKASDHAGYCRALYTKHTAFMAAGIEHRERLFLAANRIGKTETAAFEITCHMTGVYPAWWEGKRFKTPIRCWAAGDTMLSTRDILQVAMLGPIDNIDSSEWSGMLPRHRVSHISRKSGGVSKCVDQVWVRHISGKLSSLEFKSFDQGRRAFQGTEIELIWVDEEPPEDVYAECLTRTMTSQGIIIATFTPLQGLTEFLKQYLETAVMAHGDQDETRPAYQLFYPGEAGSIHPSHD